MNEYQQKEHDLRLRRLEYLKNKRLNDENPHLRPGPHDGLPDDVRYDLVVNAGRYWYALYEWGTKADGTPIWFLNPADQDKNNFGLFTLDDLKAWARNEGPIPKPEQPTKWW